MLADVRRAVEALPISATEALIDGNRCPPLRIPARAIIGGDALEPAISAASILAKTARDAEMRRIHEIFPQYGLDRHKGYDTAFHRAALEQDGPAPFHRRSFAPVKALLEVTLMSSILTIASRQNPRFKALCKLADDPARHELAIADGIHLVAACIERGVVIQQLLVSDSGMRNSEIGRLLAQCGSSECLNFSDALFREITGIAAPTGVAAVFAPPRPEASGAARRCGSARRCSGCRQRRYHPA